MMEFFEAYGQWHLLDSPETVVPGTLKFDADGINLTLIGGFARGWSAVSEDYPIIQGEVSDTPYGTAVTLINCYSAGSRFSSAGISSERIRSNRATVGDFHLDTEAYDYDYIELGYSHLSDWAARGKIDVERSRKLVVYSLSYRRPENIRSSYGDREVVLASVSQSSESLTRVVLEMDDRLLVEPAGEIPPERFGQDHIRIWQDMLTFALDRPIGATSVVYAAPKDDASIRPKVHLIYRPIFRPVPEPKRVFSPDMLFCLAEAEDAGVNVFEAWSRFYSAHPRVIRNYFPYKYDKPTYMEDKFLKIIGALKILCTDLGLVPPEAQSCVDGFRDVLLGRFPEQSVSLAEIALPAAADLALLPMMHDLLSGRVEIMGKIIRDFDQFTYEVLEILTYIVRVNEEDDEGVAQKRTKMMEWHMERLDTLIKILVLEQLSFPLDAIARLMDQRSAFVYLRTV